MKSRRSNMVFLEEYPSKSSPANHPSLTATMRKCFHHALSQNTSSGAWTKLAKVTVSPGRTAWPTSPRMKEAIGVRFDYKGEEVVKGKDNTTTTYNLFNVQPKAGKTPASIIDWRNRNGGTHAVMAVARVKKDGTQDDVEAAFKEVANYVVAGKDDEEEKKAEAETEAEQKAAAVTARKDGKKEKAKKPKA
ncbi:MAG: hypothetical protein Q9226_007045 [Calogaya cf. arnoldii]